MEGIGHDAQSLFEEICKYSSQYTIPIYSQVFLDVVGAFCAGGTCTDDAPARQVSAGLQLTFAACGVLSILG